VHSLSDASRYYGTGSVAKAKGDEPADVVIMFLFLIKWQSATHEATLGVNTEAIPDKPESHDANYSIFNVLNKNVPAMLLTRYADFKENESHLHIEDHNYDNKKPD